MIRMSVIFLNFSDGREAMINADLIKSEKRTAHFLAVEKGSLASMSRFLNRLLGLPVELQNSVFSYFSDTLLAVIAEAKRCGKYEGGIMDFGAAGERVEVQESQEFVCDPAFGTATTELHRVRSLTIVLLTIMHSLIVRKHACTIDMYILHSVWLYCKCRNFVGILISCQFHS